MKLSITLMKALTKAKEMPPLEYVQIISDDATTVNIVFVVDKVKVTDHREPDVKVSRVMAMELVHTQNAQLADGHSHAPDPKAFVNWLYDNGYRIVRKGK